MQPDRKLGSASETVDANRADFFRAVHGGDHAFLEIFMAKNPSAAKWETPDGTPMLVLAMGNAERDRWVPENNSYQQAEVIELLISYGADINAKDALGRSALLEECYGDKREDIITKLLEHGADPNVADVNGSTPLHQLVTRGWGEDIIDIVAKAGAKLDAQDNFGNTPLHVAAGDNGLDFTSGQQEAVRKLLTLGASPNIRNRMLRTPLDSANMNADFIEEEGKRPTADIIAAFVKKPAPPADKDDPAAPPRKTGGPVVPRPANGRFRPKP